MPSRSGEAPLLFAAGQWELAFVNNPTALHDEYNGLGIVDVRGRILAQQHQIGEVAFWDRIGISPLLVAEKLYGKRGDLVAMRAVMAAE